VLESKMRPRNSKNCVARRRGLEEVHHRRVVPRGRVRHVDDDLSALERLLQSVTGERVDPGVGRRRKRVLARLAELPDELRADEAAPADDDDLHLPPFVA
jgi:hypothetical protein